MDEVNETMPALAALSALLGRDLRVSGGAPTEDDSNIHCSRRGSSMTVRCSEGRSLSEEERNLIRQIARLILENRSAVQEFLEVTARLEEVQRDNVNLITLNRALTEASSRDSLTGLYARWFVLEKIEAELNRALRNGSPIALLMIDLDHFKEINDAFGHPFGDLVLREAGKVLRDSCRLYDVPGRYGGEEFCLLLPDTRLENTSVVANRIRQRLEATPFRPDGRVLTVTASIGVAALATGTAPGEISTTELIERADRAMYRAKHRGRNRIEWWDESPLEAIAGGH